MTPLEEQIRDIGAGTGAVRSGDQWPTHRAKAHRVVARRSELRRAARVAARAAVRNTTLNNRTTN